MNVYGSLNWKISPNLTLDVSHLISDQRVPNYFGIDKDRWQRRDIRDIRPDAYGYRAFDDPPEHRGDNFSMVKLLYTGENMEILRSHGRGVHMIEAFHSILAGVQVPTSGGQTQACI